MRPIRTIIIDDDADWRENITLRVKTKSTILKFMGAFDSPSAAYTLITEGVVDLIFLDIEMPEVSGIDFIKQLVKPPMVILITSHADYALQGYDIQAIDYLVKPFTDLRFSQALERLSLRWAEKNAQPTQVQEPYFLIREKNNFVKIATNDVLFLKAMENFTQIVTPNQTYLPLMSLSALEQQLSEEIFMRVHRSYIVNINKVTIFNKTELTIGTHKIPIARQYSNELLERLTQSPQIIKDIHSRYN